MKIKIVILILMTCLLTTKTLAQSKKSYVMMRLGASANKIDRKADSTKDHLKIKNSNIVDASIGYYLTPNWRMAFNFSYMPKTKISQYHNNTNSPAALFHADSYINNISVTLDNYYDLNYLSYHNITPYVMGGFGLGINQISSSALYKDNLYVSSSSSNSAKNFIWKIGAGLNYHVNDSVFIDFAYSYNHLGKIAGKAGLGHASIKANQYGYGVSQQKARFIFNEFKNLRLHNFAIGLGIKF